MDTLTLCGDYSSAFTFIQNDFIDYHLRDVNESQIKIYLYLLRSVGSNLNVSVSSIADFFNDSEKDVIRALKYLDKQKLITLEYDDDREPSGIRLLPAGASHSESDSDQNMQKENEIPEKRRYSAAELSAFIEQSEIKDLVYVTETYLKKALSPNDISSILYMNDALSMSAELIEYLIEYCVGNKRKSMRYIESVAVLWAKNGITTVEDARNYVKAFPAETGDILQAFGIKGREPLAPELSYIKKWTENSSFSVDIIKEACERTIRSINKPSFEYADRILENWKKAGVKTFADIEAQDEAFSASKKTAERVSRKKAVKDEGVSANEYVKFANRQLATKKVVQE